MPDGRIRHAIYKTFAEGGIPLLATLSHQLHIPVDTVRGAMERLHEAHAIVLDPRTREVRMALPFSSVPTPFTVKAIGDRAWFANCAWDAFGIPNLLGIDAVIETACQDCGGPIVYRIEERRLVDAHGVVHFVVPASRWWDDIGFTSSTIRFFRSEEHVQLWSAQAETPVGAIMPAANLWQLSQHWFDGRLSPDWKPRPRDRSQQLLADAGFVGQFWSLAP